MKLTHRYFGRTTGRHRAPRQTAAPGALAEQRFVRCSECGGVESAATVHGTVLLCTEGHVQPGGAA